MNQRRISRRHVPFHENITKVVCLMFRDLKIDEKCVDAIDVCEYGLCQYVVTC